ncbi:MAG: hypothetical protein ABL964_08185 [Steroidobacteraceae bacterium]
MFRHLTWLALSLALAMPAFADGESPWKDAGWCDNHYDLDKPPPPRLNLPEWVCRASFSGKLFDKYDLYVGINPLFISGDFNGDRKTDVAVWITNRTTMERGILILHQGDARYFSFAAGTDAGDRGTDWTNLDAWSPLVRGEMLSSPHEERALTLPNDAIMMVKSESLSFAIYWSDKRYEIYTLSD